MPPLSRFQGTPPGSVPRAHDAPPAFASQTVNSRRVAETAVRAQNIRQSGAVAQLGERLVCNQEVAGSIPVGSSLANHLSGAGYANLPTRAVLRTALVSWERAPLNSEAPTQWLALKGRGPAADGSSAARKSLPHASRIVKRASSKMFGSGPTVRQKAVSCARASADSESCGRRLPSEARWSETRTGHRCPRCFTASSPSPARTETQGDNRTAPAGSAKLCFARCKPEARTLWIGRLEDESDRPPCAFACRAIQPAPAKIVADSSGSTDSWGFVSGWASATKSLESRSRSSIAQVHISRRGLCRRF